MYNQF